MADARARRGRLPGVDGPNLAARGAGGVPRGDRLGRAGPADRDRQADPGRGRPGRRLGRRGSRAAPAGAPLGARRRGAAARAGRPRSARTSPASSQPGRVLVGGAGERVEPLPDPAPFGVLVLPSQATLVDRGGVRARPTGSALPRSAAELGGARPARRASASTTSSAAARSLEPSIDRGARARARGRRAPGAGVRLGPDGDRAVRRPARGRARGRCAARRRRRGVRGSPVPEGGRRAA